MKSWSEIWQWLITPMGKVPQAAQVQLDDLREQKRSLAAARVLNNQKWLTVHVAMASLREFRECSSYHNVDRRAQDVDDNWRELTLMFSKPGYLDVVNKAVDEFSKGWNTKVTEDEMQFLQHPDTIDVRCLVGEKYLFLAQSYQPYWEGAISALVRKHAITSRRKYLVDDIDAFIDCLGGQYPEAVEILRKYQAFNQQELDK